MTCNVQTSINVPLERKDGGKMDLYKGAREVRLPDAETLEKWRALVGGALVGAGGVVIEEETSKVRRCILFCWWLLSSMQSISKKTLSLNDKRQKMSRQMIYLLGWALRS